MTVELDPERLRGLHAALVRRVAREEGRDARSEDADAVRARVLARRAAQEQADKLKRQQQNRPLWISYHRSLADALDRRAQEHRQRALKLEGGTSRG